MTRPPRHASALVAIISLTAILAGAGSVAAAGLADGETDAGSQAGTATAPRIVALSPNQVLPDAVQGELISVSYSIENQGDAPLEIVRVAPSTDGLRVLSGPERLAPGEKGTIRAEKRLGPRDEGPGRLVLSVYSNDPQTPRLDLVAELKAEVFVDAEPGYARWIYVRGENEGTIQQTISSRDGEPFEIVGLENPQPGLSIDVETPPESSEGKPGTRWILRMTLDQDAPVGPIEGSVILRLDHPSQKRLEIPVSGFVRPPLFVTPAEFRFGEVTLDEPAMQPFYLQVFTKAPIHVEEVTHDLPGVGPANVVELEPGHGYRIEVTFGPEVPEGPLEGAIQIRTDSDLVPVVTIPVEGTIR